MYKHVVVGIAVHLEISDVATTCDTTRPYNSWKVQTSAGGARPNTGSRVDRDASRCMRRRSRMVHRENIKRRVLIFHPCLRLDLQDIPQYFA